MSPVAILDSKKPIEGKGNHNMCPAQLLMGHSPRTTLPQVVDQYKLHWQYLESFQELNAEFKHKQKTAYNQRHRAHSLTPISEEEEVWITSGQSITSRQAKSQAGLTL